MSIFEIVMGTISLVFFTIAIFYSGAIYGFKRSDTLHQEFMESMEKLTKKTRNK